MIHGQMVWQLQQEFVASLVPVPFPQFGGEEMDQPQLAAEITLRTT